MSGSNLRIAQYQRVTPAPQLTQAAATGPAGQPSDLRTSPAQPKPQVFSFTDFLAARGLGDEAARSPKRQRDQHMPTPTAPKQVAQHVRATSRRVDRHQSDSQLNGSAPDVQHRHGPVTSMQQQPTDMHSTPPRAQLGSITSDLPSSLLAGAAASNTFGVAPVAAQGAASWSMLAPSPNNIATIKDTSASPPPQMSGQTKHFDTPESRTIGRPSVQPEQALRKGAGVQQPPEFPSVLQDAARCASCCLKAMTCSST